MAVSSTFTAADGDGSELQMGRWSQRLAQPFLDFSGFADGERVLDAGCGTGSLTFLLLNEREFVAFLDWIFPPPILSTPSGAIAILGSNSVSEMFVNYRLRMRLSIEFFRCLCCTLCRKRIELSPSCAE